MIAVLLFWEWKKNVVTGTGLVGFIIGPCCFDSFSVAYHIYQTSGANMNAIRTKTLLSEADVVVVRFGEKYRQWNAAFDAGYASALGKPVITLHPPSISHMLKEVNAGANAVCEEPEQVVDTLAYVIRGDLPPPRDGDAWIPIADRLGKGNPNP